MMLRIDAGLTQAGAPALRRCLCVCWLPSCCARGLGRGGAGGGAGAGFYVAAVYEHRVVLNPRPDVRLSWQAALEHMKQNLDVFEEQTAAAAKQGQIIVFPEDAIHGFNFTRESIAGYLETVPDPTVVSWNPCSDPTRFPNTEVLHRLSCMAKNNSIYLFNTDVVFSSAGALVARYRKQNLYFEAAFDTPPDRALITFHTPFAGRFGVLTCFDLLFARPAAALVESAGVRQLVYPTAWPNQLPLLAAVQIQRSFSYAAGAALLAANGALYHHAGAGEEEEGRLLVHTLPVLDPLRAQGGPAPPPPFTGQSEPQYCLRGGGQGAEGEECVGWSVPPGGPGAPGGPGDTFTAEMMYDRFTMATLRGGEGELSVCHGALCCHLLFRRRWAAPGELYALAAFDGLHTVHGTYYLQVCALVSARHVFPGLLADAMALELPNHSGREGRSFAMSRRGMGRGLVTAVLYGRAYDRDHS
ncbi:hypothetical protein AAFF_G00265000 [Aldrovandia affinis]|uniref:Biotinidase n=1 Tax=Aldrovandia affinis TaxID=143900 RepID=A0AAD7RC45_9TELE|nr:hypothetical protein AAFF_G00265000 [Aldrovandia affinis]